MSNCGTYRLLRDSSKICGSKEAVNQRRFTNESTPDDNMMMMHYDICS